jgi:leucyl aminopeptidase
MRLSAAPRSALATSAPLVALLVDGDKLAGVPAGPLYQRAAQLLARKTWKAERRKTLLLHAEAAGGPRALLLVGTGPAREVSGEDLRRAAAIAVNTASELGARELVLAEVGHLKLNDERVQALGEGALLAAYRYSGKPAETTPPADVRVVADGRGARKALSVAQALGEASNLVRHLGDLPGNRCPPRHLARTAQGVARKGRLRCKVHGKAGLKKLRMGGILAVNQGSAEEPFLVEMEYKPAGRARATVCVVGKGLTFDSGGISIKPADKMEDMKYDMCGAAAVIGLMQALAALRPKGVRVLGIFGTTENLLGPSAYKPGDVVTTAAGKTIEVINTDAEGRVVLADALHHAAGFKPDAIIDLATLTGAIVVALGTETAGLFCKDDALAERLLAASRRTHERLWRMPTYDEYGERIKSKWADIKNSAGREAGSCTAAQFLFHFSAGIPHAHLDIAGTAWDGRKRDYHTEGGTGFGVRLLYDALNNW